MKNKKILILANSIVGIYKFRKELINELINSNYIIYISSPNDNNFFWEELKNRGISLIETRIERRGSNPVKDFKLFINYLKMIEKINPETILTYTIKPNIYGGIAAGLKKIKYIPNITGLGSGIKKSKTFYRIIVVLYKIALKKAFGIFVQNLENYSFIKSITNKNANIKLLPGSGVNISEYKLLEYPKGDKISFMFISRIMKEKGIEEYIEAATIIKNKYPNIEFNVIGPCEEDYLERLKELSRKQIINYYGQQNNVIDFHNTSWCTVHPTFYPEGMSNVLLESASCGRPIITTKIHGCMEIVDDGENGFIVEEKNSLDLIEKIEKFITLSYDEKKKMGINGRRKIEREFDRNIVVDSYMRIIKSEDKL